MTTINPTAMMKTPDQAFADAQACGICAGQIEPASLTTFAGQRAHKLCVETVERNGDAPMMEAKIKGLPIPIRAADAPALLAIFTVEFPSPDGA